MLLIVGFRSLLKVLRRDEMACPRCEADTPYRLVRPRRWFTLFFVPVVPLRAQEPYVRCEGCQGRFSTYVLRRPTSARLTTMLALGARAYYAKVAGSLDLAAEERVDFALDALRPFVAVTFVERNVENDLDEFCDADLGPRLTPLADHLRPQGREQLVLGAVRLVLAAGEEPLTHPVIHEGAALLGVTSAHLRGIVATVGRGRSTLDAGEG